MKKDGGAEVDIILYQPGCRCEEGGEIHTGNKPWSSHNDNMASDFSTPQFHAINDVCLHYVGLRNQLFLNMFFTCKKYMREWSIYVQLNCFVALI